MAKGFLTCLYCIYFTSWGRIVHFVSVLCVFCACSALFTFLQSAHCQPACDSSPVARNRRCAYRSENRHNLNTLVKPWFNWLNMLVCFEFASYIMNLALICVEKVVLD